MFWCHLVPSLSPSLSRALDLSFFSYSWWEHYTICNTCRFSLAAFAHSPNVEYSLCEYTIKIPREENHHTHHTPSLFATNGSSHCKTIFTIPKLDSKKSRKNWMNFHELSFRLLKSNFLSAFDALNHILHLTHTYNVVFCPSLHMLELISFKITKKIRSSENVWVRVWIYLPALIDKIYSLTHSEYLSLFMFNFMLLLAPTQISTGTKSNTNRSHIHRIIQSIRMTAFYICCV